MLKLALWLTIVFTGVALSDVAHAQFSQNQRAAWPTPPPLSCAAGAATIQAVPDASGNWPVPVTCPANPFGAVNCLRWSYSYSGSGNISVSAITMDSDADLVDATSGPLPGTTGGMKVYSPGESDSSIGQAGTNTLDVRTIKFSASAPVVGHLYTKADIGIGTVTAIAKVGNSGPLTCRIAGPDNTGIAASVGAAPFTTTQIDQYQECQITLTLDAKGCPADVVATSSVPGVTCPVAEVTTIDSGKTIKGGQCKGGTSGLVTEGSTCVWYCPTSAGTCFKVCRNP